MKTQLDLLVRTPTESKVKDFLKPKMLLQFIKVRCSKFLSSAIRSDLVKDILSFLLPY